MVEGMATGIKHTTNKRSKYVSACLPSKVRIVLNLHPVLYNYIVCYIGYMHLFI